MKVLKATKTFRQVTLFMSLIFSIGAIVTAAVPQGDCPGVNLKAAVGMMAAVWISTFILLLLQVIGYVGIIKRHPKIMFVFYFFVSACMFFVQMLLFAGVEGQKNSCMTAVPA